MHNDCIPVRVPRNSCRADTLHARCQHTGTGVTRGGNPPRTISSALDLQSPNRDPRPADRCSVCRRAPYSCHVTISLQAVQVSRIPEMDHKLTSMLHRAPALREDSPSSISISRSKTSQSYRKRKPTPLASREAKGDRQIAPFSRSPCRTRSLAPHQGGSNERLPPAAQGVASNAQPGSLTAGHINSASGACSALTIASGRQRHCNGLRNAAARTGNDAPAGQREAAASWRWQSASSGHSTGNRLHNRRSRPWLSFGLPKSRAAPAQQQQVDHERSRHAEYAPCSSRSASGKCPSTSGRHACQSAMMCGWRSGSRSSSDCLIPVPDRS